MALVVAAAGFAGVRVDRSVPAVVTASSAPSATVPGAAPTVPWPAAGQAAILVPASGFRAQSGPETPVPVASLTKVTTAIVILRDHPLATDADGPSITMTPDDVAQYGAEVATDQSAVPIEAGEVLTLRQAMEALLTQSANDVAYALAVWDAGTLGGFVAKMNATATALGATSSHYVDASGYDSGSVSTASDCLRIAAVAMTLPAFVQVAGMSSVTLPIVGTRANIVSEIGANGVVGVKSGFTTAAGACLLLAARPDVGGQSVLVLVATVGQPFTGPASQVTASVSGGGRSVTAPVAGPQTTTPPVTVAPSDQGPADVFRYSRPIVDQLLSVARSAVAPVTMADNHRPVGAALGGGTSASRAVHIVPGHTVSFVGWPGQAGSMSIFFRAVGDGARAGTKVGVARYRLGPQVATVPLVTAGRVPEPDWWWRLLHG